MTTLITFIRFSGGFKSLIRVEKRIESVEVKTLNTNSDYVQWVQGIGGVRPSWCLEEVFKSLTLYIDRNDLGESEKLMQEIMGKTAGTNFEGKNKND